MSTDTWLLIAILVLAIISLFVRGGGDSSGRLAALDHKLDLILKNLGIDPHEGLDTRIVELVRGGQKIEAIKLYRSQTGVGLKEAKDYVESLGMFLQRMLSS